jgi:hypothetical protein
MGLEAPSGGPHRFGNSGRGRWPASPRVARPRVGSADRAGTPTTRASPRPDSFSTPLDPSRSFWTRSMSMRPGSTPPPSPRRESAATRRTRTAAASCATRPANRPDCCSSWLWSWFAGSCRSPSPPASVRPSSRPRPSHTGVESRGSGHGRPGRARSVSRTGARGDCSGFGCCFTLLWPTCPV